MAFVYFLRCVSHILLIWATIVLVQKLLESIETCMFNIQYVSPHDVFLVGCLIYMKGSFVSHCVTNASQVGG